MMDWNVPRVAALKLREVVIALALNVFQAQHAAVYSYYQDLIRDTPAAELDADPFPPAPDAEASDAGGGNEQ